MQTFDFMQIGKKKAVTMDESSFMLSAPNFYNLISQMEGTECCSKLSNTLPCVYNVSKWDFVVAKLPVKVVTVTGRRC